MRFPALLPLVLLPLTLLPGSTTASSPPSTITFTLPGSHPAEPPTTSLLLLSTHGRKTEPITSAGRAFRLHNIPAGSYLVEVASREYTYVPLRVDIGADGRVEGAWATWRGNAWGNKGVVAWKDGRVGLVPLRKAEYYTPREAFNPLKLLGSPMILLAIVSLGAIVGIPKLMDMIDPELKAEFEEQQRKTLTMAAGGGMGAMGRPSTGPAPALPDANPFAGFDFAGFLAGKTAAVGGSGAGQSTASGSAAAGAGEKRKR